MADAYRAAETIIGKLEARLESDGWTRNRDGEWEKELGPDELGDLSRHIGQGPLDAIMSGRAAHVWQPGARGVADFVAESYVTGEIEEGIVEFAGLSAEEEDWLEDPECLDEVSSFVQGFVCPTVDVGYVESMLG